VEPLRGIETGDGHQPGIKVSQAVRCWAQTQRPHVAEGKKRSSPHLRTVAAKKARQGVASQFQLVQKIGHEEATSAPPVVSACGGDEKRWA